MAQKKKTTRGVSQNGFNGNAVRALRPEEDPWYIEQERQRRRDAAKKHNRELEQKREARRIQSLSIPAFVVLVVCLTAFLYSGSEYLHMRSELNNHMSNVRALETKLDNLRTENDALEESIITAVDLSEVYDIAINRLHMVHASADNTISYSKTESEYVRQYDEIPATQ